MTAITASQLDVIERRANDYNETDLSLVPVECEMALHLVAIARAALAWSEARWQHNDAAMAHGILSGEARTAFAALDPLTEQLDAIVRGAP